MASERWQRIEQLYHLALEQDKVSRPGFVAQACGGDEALRFEVESLLAAGDGADDYLEKPALDVVAKARAQDGPIPAFRPRTAPARLGRYEVSGEIGEGGMGTVYQGVDPVIGRTVAIKTILQDRLGSPGEASHLGQRLLREARTAGGLSHPNIVTVFDAGAEGGVTYIVMELVQGSTLEAILPGKGKPLPVERALAILTAAAAALDFAHSHHVVHRDVKPSNIMIQADGVVKLADFGIAKLVNAQTLTSSLGVVGSPYFMSPEQLRGDDATPRSDQYSLAMVAWILLTGSRLFGDTDLVSLISRILREDPPPNNHLTPAAYGVLRRALAKDAAARFESCSAFVKALSHACIGQPAAKPQFVPARPRRFWVAGVAAGCLLAGAGAAWRWHPQASGIAPKAGDSARAVVEAPLKEAPAAPPPVVASVAKSTARVLPPAAPARNTAPPLPCASLKFDLKLYGDALSGEMIWAGSLAHGARVNIENRLASAGGVQGDVLPQGAPVRVSVSPATVRLDAAPAQANCWAPRLILRNTGETVDEIRIRWEVYQP